MPESFSWEERFPRTHAEPYGRLRRQGLPAGVSLGVRGMASPAPQAAEGVRTGYIPSEALENPITGPKVRAEAGTVTDVAFGAVRGPDGGRVPNDDPDTGLYFPAADQVAVACGGEQKVAYTADTTSHLESQRFTVTEVAVGPYTVTDAHYAFMIDTSVAITFNLPTAVGRSGQVYVFKDKTGNSAANNVTITPSLAETIDGAATLVMNVNKVSYTIMSNGINWYII